MLLGASVLQPTSKHTPPHPPTLQRGWGGEGSLGVCSQTCYVVGTREMRTFLGNETSRLVLPALKVWLRVQVWLEGKGQGWGQVVVGGDGVGGWEWEY